MNWLCTKCRCMKEGHCSRCILHGVKGSAVGAQTKCGAGFQPAVSQLPACGRAEFSGTPRGWRTVCRLQIGDTAGWKPALRGHSFVADGSAVRHYESA